MGSPPYYSPGDIRPWIPHDERELIEHEERHNPDFQHLLANRPVSPPNEFSVLTAAPRTGSHDMVVNVASLALPDERVASNRPTPVSSKFKMRARIPPGQFLFVSL